MPVVYLKVILENRRKSGEKEVRKEGMLRNNVFSRLQAGFFHSPQIRGLRPSELEHLPTGSYSLWLRVPPVGGDWLPTLAGCADEWVEFLQYRETVGITWENTVFQVDPVSSR